MDEWTAAPHTEDPTAGSPNVGVGQQFFRTIAAPLGRRPPPGQHALQGAVAAGVLMPECRGNMQPDQ